MVIHELMIGTRLDKFMVIKELMISTRLDELIVIHELRTSINYMVVCACRCLGNRSISQTSMPLE